MKETLNSKRIKVFVSHVYFDAIIVISLYLACCR